VILPGAIHLRHTLESGQVFHWERQPDGSWAGLVDAMPACVREVDGHLAVEQGSPDSIASFFSLDHDLGSIHKNFPDEPLSRAALEYCGNLRIIRQPLWECVATFITSSMKQVSHIRGMSLAIRHRFGWTPDGARVPAYPSFGTLALAGEQDLRACGLGYRAANLLATARLLDSGAVNLEKISRLRTPALRKVLTTLPGVGVKVANCILLFAYGRLDSVPIDTWIHRLLLVMRAGRPGTAAQLARYARRRLGPSAGYVQQYLFHHARALKRLHGAKFILDSRHRG
jgi:N-glycosylase/DNA lyase